MSIEELKELQNKVIKRNNELTRMFKIFAAVILTITLFVFVFFIIGMGIKEGIFLVFPLFFFISFETIFCYIVFSIIRSIIFKDDTKVFKDNYKKIFVLESLKEIFDNLTYTPDKGVDKETVKESGIIFLQDRFFSNDYISGAYKNIKFEQSDVHIQERVVEEDDKGNKTESWVTTFLGRWMNFDFNKEFKTNVIIFNSKGFKWWGKYNRVKMEDDEFNNTFSVYAENEHEAFYILTPHFMERLKNIEKMINGHITFGFINKRLYIALNDANDSFEYDIFKPINETEVKNSIMRDIKTITNFVDELNLDNDLFKEV